MSRDAKRPRRRKRPAPEGFDEAPPPLPGPLLPAGEERERPSPSPPTSPAASRFERKARTVPPTSPLRPTGPSGPDGATAPRAYARSQASVARSRARHHDASARRLREMNKWGEGQGEVGYRKAQRACETGCRPLILLVYLGRNPTEAHDGPDRRHRRQKAPAPPARPRRATLLLVILYPPSPIRHSRAITLYERAIYAEYKIH